MKDMGFVQMFSDTENPQGYLTTAFHYPSNPLFVFEEFQSRLSDYGKIQCMFKSSKVTALHLIS